MDGISLRMVLLSFFWVLGGFWTVYGAANFFGSAVGWLALGLVVLLWCSVMTLAEARLLARMRLHRDLEQSLHRRRHLGE